MAVTNNTILGNIALAATNDYQQRVPWPTQENISETVEYLTNPFNRDCWNEFSANLMNMIAQTYVVDRVFRHPLRDLRKSRVDYGNTIREVAPKWFKSHSFGDNTETLLKMARPEYASVYYSVNRKDRYDCTITDAEIRRAFDSPTGLNDLIAATLTAVANSDMYDEMNIMLQLIAEQDARHGIWKQNISAAPTTEATCKELLRQIRSYAGKFKFPSTLYNSLDIDDVPVFEDDSSLLVVLVTPEVMAALDVEALAGVFQLDKADIKYRIIEVPEFPMPDVYAMLTTVDFFECHDTVFGIYPAPFNAETLSQKYYLHHQSIEAVNPFVPAVLFTTGTGSSANTVTQAVTGISMAIVDEDGNAASALSAGATYYIRNTLAGTISGNTAGADIAVRPDSVTYELVGTDVELNGATRIVTGQYVEGISDSQDDLVDVLHVQKSGIVSGSEIAITATATYTNPSGATSEYTDSETLTAA